MKKFALSPFALSILSALTLIVCVGDAMAMDESQVAHGNVRADCKLEGEKFEGADRTRFVRKCIIERTSRADKVSSCEGQIGVAVSARAMRDNPELRAKFIESCVETWDPKYK